MNYKLSDTLLKIENLSLSYKKQLVLRDINLEIKDISVEGTTTGQILTLVGRSGVGKTQLFKQIAGLSIPTKGSVLVGKNQEPTKPGVVGMVLQDYPLFSHYTVLGNLELVCKKDKDRIDYYLNEFDIYDHRNKYVSQLSGGQRQRSAIVQQLLCSEHFTLLDEPFSGLDPVAIDKLCRIIIKVTNLNEQNTVIISSHILEPAMAISDTVVMLGHQYGKEEGKEELVKIEGATIVHIENLAEQGLSWNPDIRKEIRFVHKVEEIRELFHKI